MQALKDIQQVGAKISELHAGFIINFNKANAKDVKEIIEYAKAQVYEKFNRKYSSYKNKL